MTKDRQNPTKVNIRFYQFYPAAVLVCVLALFTSSAANASADLEIISDAPSHVFLNDTFVGETPLAIFDISAGMHKIEVRRPGHEAYSRNITILESGSHRPSIRINAVLERIHVTPPATHTTIIHTHQPRPLKKIKGTLAITSYPRGARVYLDGRYIGHTPIQVSGEAGTRHHILIRRNGYRDHVETAHIPGRRTTTISASLRRLTSSGSHTHTTTYTSSSRDTSSGSNGQNNLRNVLFGAAVINEAFTGNDREKNRNRNSILGGMLLNEIFNQN